MDKSEDEWREILTEKEFKVLRDSGTEAKFSGELINEKKDGLYRCKGCGSVLFDSDSKFESYTGWPSFSDIYEESNITKNVDKSHGIVRTEVRCNECDGHLGHVFDDGPKPTGKRYCINSVCLDFEAKNDD